MLARKFRLPSADFKKIRESRVRPVFSSKYFSLRRVFNGLPRNRFGIVLGNAVSKKSTQRHFLKRIITECLRGWSGSGNDFLVVVSSRAGQASKKEIQEELAAARSATSRAQE